MLTNNISVLIVAALLTGSLRASPQEQIPNGELDRQLHSAFAPTKLASDRVKVVQAGTVLSVQKDGIGAISPNPGMGRLSGGDQGFYPNVYKAGAVKHDSLRGMLLERVGTLRDLAVEERVYVLKIEYKSNAVVLDVQTCGTCDPRLPDPENVPARAAIAFQFPKGFLETATPVQVQTVIGHVLAPQAAGDATATEQGSAGPARQPEAPPAPPAVPAAPMAAIPPPPPPADAPATPPSTVELGQTTGEVVAAMGQPTRILNGAAGKQIYLYKGLKVTFLKGKVSDIE